MSQHMDSQNSSCGQAFNRPKILQEALNTNNLALSHPCLKNLAKLANL